MDQEQRKKRLNHILAAMENNAGMVSGSSPVRPPVATFFPARNLDPERDMPSLNAFKEEIFAELGEQSSPDAPEGFHSGVLEKATAYGIRQLACFRLKPAGGRFILEEAVENYLRQGEILARSRLAVVDDEAGQSLDLNRFLPVGCSFAPSHLLRLRVEFDRQNRRLKSEFSPVSLKSYRGADNNEGDFYFNREVGRIAYGNLTAPGSLFILLHEIVHSWQFAFQGKTAENDFSKLFTFLSHHLNKLGARIEGHREKAISDATLSHFIDTVTEKLREKDIALDTAGITGGSRTLPGKSMSYTARNGTRFFFESNSFVEALREYIWVERDAWSYALRVLRLLRKRGFDLEPGLRNLQDVKDFIYPHLENYQHSIQSHIDTGSEKIKFIAKKRKTTVKEA